MIARKISALLLPLVLLTACATKAPAPVTQNPVPAPAPTTQVDATKTTYPLTIIDDAGRTVTIAAEPKRVVSVAPSNTELLFALGKGDILVGRSEFDDYPAEAAKIPSVGGFFPPNYEAIVAAKPDLLLMIGGSVAERDKLANEYKLPVLVLDAQNFEAVYKDIEMLGKVVNAQQAANKLVEQMRAEVAAVHDTVKGKAKPTIFYESWHDPLMTAGQKTFIDDLVTLAGGTNIAADVEGWTTYNLEQVQAKDPEFYVTSKEEVASVGQRPGFAGLKAVKEQKVFAMDDPNIAVRPGPRLVEGLKWFAKLLHPELF